MTFQQWQGRILEFLRDYPAMVPDAEPVVVPPADANAWLTRARYESGVTVESMCAQLHAMFNHWGW